MKTDKTIFTLLLLVVSSVLFSCDKEYVYGTEIRIENASQHDIGIIMPELWLDGSVFPEKIVLPRGQNFSHIIIGEGGFVGVPDFPSMLIRFDNDISITHIQSDGNAYHNFCDNGPIFEISLRKDMRYSHLSLRMKITDMPNNMRMKQINSLMNSLRLGSIVMLCGVLPDCDYISHRMGASWRMGLSE